MAQEETTLDLPRVFLDDVEIFIISGYFNMRITLHIFQKIMILIIICTFIFNYLFEMNSNPSIISSSIV